MPPRSLRLLGRQLTAAALAAALALSGSGPIYAAEIRAASGRAQSGGRAGPTGVPALPNVLAPLSPAALPGAPAPAAGLSAPSAGPAIAPPAAELGGHPRALPVRTVPSLLPAGSLEPSAELPAESGAADAKEFADAEFRRLGAEADPSSTDGGSASAPRGSIDAKVSGAARRMGRLKPKSAAEAPLPEAARGA
ncbi:MAG: hypothetical protein HY403_04770, partial [Elusimicrobia bacterium]|nr:hypothetical protein [Elusimicrobiota bacterium]